MRIILLPALLVACVPAARPPLLSPQTPAAPPPAPPVRPLAADWREWPVAAGVWRYQGGTATFGRGPVQVRCDRASRQVVLATGAPGPITVRTSSTTRTLPATGAQVGIAATDPLLDAVAFSRGRFTVEQPGRPPLVLPSHAEIARVVEDCRS